MKAAVKLTLIAIAASFIVISAGLLIPTFSQAGGPTLDNVQWNKIEINFNKTMTSLTEQTSIFYIKQTFSQTGVKLNLTTIFNQTSYSIDDLKGAKLFTKENVTYVEKRVEKTGATCTTIEGNDTQKEICIDNFQEVERLKWRWEWVESKDFLFNKNLAKKEVTSPSFTITIPKLADLDEYRNNGTKWFKLIIPTPISDYNGGWGSSTYFAIRLDDATSSKEAHPWFNLSYDFRTNITTTLETPRFSIGTDANRVFMPIVVNTSNLTMNSICSDLAIANSSNHEQNYVWENYTSSTYGCRTSQTTVWIYGRYTDNNNTIESIYHGNNTLDPTLKNSSRPVDVLSEIHFSSHNGSGYRDSSPQNTAGGFSLVAGTKQQVTGIFGDAGKFDASTYYQSDSDHGKHLEGFTIITLFRKTSGVGGTHQQLFAKTNDATTGWQYYWEGGILNFAPSFEGASFQLVSISGLSESRWYISAGRVRSGVSVELMVWDTNGTKFLKVTNTTGTKIAKNNQALTIGARSDAIQQFGGFFDAIFFLNYSTTDSELNATVSAMLSRNFTDLMTRQATEERPSGGSNANETEGRSAIEQGVRDSLGIGATIYTDQQIYTRNISGGQQLAKFDKFTLNGTKRWAFNYITSGENFTNMRNITPTFYVLEIENMLPSQIRDRVSGFINQTK